MTAICLLEKVTAILTLVTSSLVFFRYQVIGPNNVAVPTHFFKVVVGETESRDLELEAFVLPNEAIPDSTPLASFQVNSTKNQGLHTH